MSRVVYEFPDPDSRVSFDDYQRQAPAHFYRPDDDAILFDHFPGIEVALLPNQQGHIDVSPSIAKVVTSDPRSADVFVLNHGITVWFGDSGVEISYSAMGFTGITSDGDLVVQVDADVAISEPPSSVMWKFRGDAVERLFHAIARCCQLVAADTTDDDQESSGSGLGWTVDGDWSVSSGVADDLDAAASVTDGDDAAMSVDVGYASTVGTKRSMRDSLSTKRSKTH